MGWFDVDKAGLAAILERRGKAFAVCELVANAWDTGAQHVDITLTPMPGSPYAELSVEDDGEGFADLDHAYTMFVRSSRADKPHLRGRFNLGEKLVLACCRTATIHTTSGAVTFANGERKRSANRRDVGTLFTAEIRMTREEYAECCEVMRRLIPPVATAFNGVEIERPDSLCRFETKLPTEIADANGMLRRTVRTAAVEVYESGDPNRGEILELGIPVIETKNGYRVNVLQKIPLNLDRDNVTPAFLRAVQVALLNHVHDHVTTEQAAAPWAQEAAGDARATTETVKAVITKRFGDRAVVTTPGDPVANANAEAAGFTVIPGGALSADVWANVRKSNILLPSAKVFPTPKPETLAGQQKCPTCGRPM